MVIHLASVVLACGFGGSDPEVPSRMSLEPPPWLADRGEGVHTSMFGTYIRKSEFQVYLFYEYSLNRDAEYKPEELGFAGTTDYFAKRTDHEVLLFAAYGITEDFAVELESALWTRATQRKAPQDTSAMPAMIRESGLGDTEGQLRWRFVRESEGVPEAMAYFETVFPLQKQRVLIGTGDWEFKLGVQVTKGFSWGTLAGRVSIAHDRGEGETEMGEYAIEYVKRLSGSTRIVLCVEGTQDEVEGIVEFQWWPWKNVMLKFNNAFGLTSKAPDWAPEVGILISF